MSNVSYDITFNVCDNECEVCKLKFDWNPNFETFNHCKNCGCHFFWKNGPIPGKCFRCAMLCKKCDRYFFNKDIVRILSGFFCRWCIMVQCKKCNKYFDKLPEYMMCSNCFTKDVMCYRVTNGLS